MAKLETFILLEDAAQKYNLHAHALIDLVEQGKLRAVRVDHTIAVAEDEVLEIVSVSNRTHRTDELGAL